MGKPNVVKELMLGETKVKICDNACRNRSQEEIKEILDTIVKLAVSEVLNRSTAQAVASGRANERRKT